MKIILTYIILFALLQGCSSNKELQKTTKTSSLSKPLNLKVDENEKIRESLFKHSLFKYKKNKSDFGITVYYFLGVNGKNPSDKLMNKMKKTGYKVYPISDAKVRHKVLKVGKNLELFGTRYHKELGGIGIVFGQGKITKINKNTVKVHWYDAISGLHASVKTITLVLKKGEWKVINTKIDAVS